MRLFILKKYHCLFFFLLIPFWGQAQNNVPEPLHVTFDKDFYVAGEDIWYSVFFLSPQTRQSSIVHTELWNAQGEMILNQQLKVSKPQVHGDIALPPDIPSGYYLFRAYTLWNLNFSPQIMYTALLPIYQPALEGELEPLEELEAYQTRAVGNLQISPIKNTFTPREKVSITLQSASSLAGKAHVSMVVKDLQYVHSSSAILEASKQATNLKANLNLPTGGLIAPEDKLRKRFVLTHPETKVPVESPYVVGFVNQTGQRLVKPVENGGVTFDFFDFFDSTTVQIFDASPYEATYTPIVKEVPIGEVLLAPQIVESMPPLTPEVQQYIQEYQRRFQLDKLFGSLTNIRAQRNIVKATRPTPTTSYAVDDYNPYDGVEDFVKNAVPPLRIRTKRAKNFDPDDPKYDKSFKLYIPNDYTLTRNDRVKKPPLLQVNEYFTYDVNAVMALNWNNISRLDIYNRLLNLPDQFGPIGEFGVISFITRDGETPSNISKSRNNVDIAGYYSPRIFNLPQVGKQGPLDSKIPDFRPVFHWNPSIEIEPGTPLSLDWYLHDKPGTYLIQVEGIWDNGTPILYEKVITVGFDQ